MHGIARARRQRAREEKSRRITAHFRYDLKLRFMLPDAFFGQRQRLSRILPAMF